MRSELSPVTPAEPARPRRAGAAWLLLALACGSTSAQWTNWRGPTHDGVSDETGLISSWSPQGENLIWKAEFIGRSTPVVFDGRVCVSGRYGEGIDRQEVVACYDAETGAKLWEDRFNVYNTTVPFNRVGWASLTADPETGHVYAHGVAGQLICYDRKGKIVWSHFLTEVLGELSGYGGRTQTPIIDGDQLLHSSVTSNWGRDAAPRHRYFSFDKRTGELQWISTPGGMPDDMNTQSVLVVTEIGGQRLLVAGNADGWIYALRVATGEKVWSFEFSKRGLNSNVLVHGDRIYASHSEENIDSAVQGRVICIDGTGSGNVTKSHEVWRIENVLSGFPSPALKDGLLYIIDNSANLYGIEAATGKILWQHSLGTVGKGSPVWADGKLYVTETNGRFHILRPGPAGVEVLDHDELKMPDGRPAELYGSPAIGYGRIYFTTEEGLYCLGDKTAKFRRGPAPPPAAQAPAGEGPPVFLRVSPAETLIKPGESVQFEVVGFDARGRPLGPQKVEWSLQGLDGAVAGGKYTAGAGRFQAGSVLVRQGQLSNEARVRVIPDLPWSIDFENFEVGSVPPTWVGAPKKWEIRDMDGNKVLAKLFRPSGVLRNMTYLGRSDWTNYTIEADVMGGKSGRRLTDVGLIAGGYTLDLMGNQQRLQARSWPAEGRMTREVAFAWEMGVWYRMKLRVEHDGKQATVLGKVWRKDTPEPAEWTIRADDPYPIAGGSPGLVGYSAADLFYDNLKVTVN